MLQGLQTEDRIEGGVPDRQRLTRGAQVGGRVGHQVRSGIANPRPGEE